MTQYPALQVKDERMGSEILVTKKRRIRKYPEVIIEPSGEKIDLVEFIEMVLDFEEDDK